MRTIILSGPTAGGKSDLALEMARKDPAIEIINADSLQVYREMDIGTAKPTKSERDEVPHHLIDIRNPNEEFSAGDFIRMLTPVMAEIHSRDHRALIVGGSAFYLKALLFGLWAAPPADLGLRAELESVETPELYQRLLKLDPEAGKTIHSQDRYRIIRAIEICQNASGLRPSELAKTSSQAHNPDFELVVMDRDQVELFERIRMRTKAMLEAGLLQETERLLSLYPKSRALKSVGYAQCVLYLRGVKPPGRKPVAGLSGLQDEIELATRQLVKKQRTFLRGLCARLKITPFVLEKDRQALVERLGLEPGNQARG